MIAGTLKLSEPKSIHHVDEIIVHKFYNRKDSWKNDIALLKVSYYLRTLRFFSF